MRQSLFLASVCLSVSLFETLFFSFFLSYQYPYYHILHFILNPTLVWKHTYHSVHLYIYFVFLLLLCLHVSIFLSHNSGVIITFPFFYSSFFSADFGNLLYTVYIFNNAVFLQLLILSTLSIYFPKI